MDSYCGHRYMPSPEEGTMVQDTSSNDNGAYYEGNAYATSLKSIPFCRTSNTIHKQDIGTLPYLSTGSIHTTQDISSARDYSHSSVDEGLERSPILFSQSQGLSIGASAQQAFDDILDRTKAKRISLQDLPHPSKLRYKKGNKIVKSKKRRESRDVEKYIEELKRKQKINHETTDLSSIRHNLLLKCGLNPWPNRNPRHGNTHGNSSQTQNDSNNERVSINQDIRIPTNHETTEGREFDFRDEDIANEFMLSFTEPEFIDTRTDALYRSQIRDSEDVDGGRYSGDVRNDIPDLHGLTQVSHNQGDSYGRSNPRYGHSSPRCTTNPIYSQNSPKYGQNAHIYGQSSSRYSQANARFERNSPGHGQNSPRYEQNSSRYGPNNSYYGHNSPQYGQNSPVYGQHSRTYGQKSPRYGYTAPTVEDKENYNSGPHTENTRGESKNQRMIPISRMEVNNMKDMYNAQQFYEE